MQYVFPIHSVVDVITNSSTVIYTEASNNAIRVITELLDDILKAAGSSRKAKDLFDFKVRRLPREDLADWLRWYAKHYDAFPELTEQIEALDDYREQHQLAEKLVEENRQELLKYFRENDVDEGATQLIVTTKDGTDIRFAERIIASLDITSSYDG